MADEHGGSPQALQTESLKHSEEDEDVEGGGDELEEGGSGGELRSPESEVGHASRETQSETLELAEKDRSGGEGFQANSSMESNDRAKSEERNGAPHEKVVPVATVDDAEAQMRNYQKSKLSQTAAIQGVDVQTENQHRLVVCPTLSQLSPTSVTQPISSSSSPTRKENDLRNPKEEQQNSSAHKPVTPLTITRVPSSDGYNWRKYGQKQVKSPKGSRGYFKCTYSECYAKKIECCDHSGCITKTVYKSQHTHDPPKKPSSARDNKVPSSKQICNTPKDSDPSTSAKETTHETLLLPDRKRPLLASPDEKNSIVLFKNEHADEPEPKRRLKKSRGEYSDSLLKPNKKPKFVVHAAGDVGISGDGYRWRKYGQKMVKGNPHPRNYYRCTSAGCPVRKYIETAVENTSAIIITYKGVHDHAMPVPKKRHGPPSAPLIAASAPASLQFKKPEKAQSQSQTKWSVGDEGELTGEDLELGSEKAIESARTLLSIGFEIKPC